MSAVDRSTSITSNQIRKHTLQQDDINPASLVWQDPIEDKDLIAPPSSGNAEGDRYIVANTFSYDLLDEDCAAIDDWVDDDAVNGESTQVSYDGKSCFKLDTNIADTSNWAFRNRTLSHSTNFTVEFNLYCDAISDNETNALVFNYDGGFEGEGTRLMLNFRSDGLFTTTDGGSAWQEIGTNLVIQDQWQKWRFEVNGTTDTCDVYLDDTLVASDIDCGTTVGSGNTFLVLNGANDNDRIVYFDYIKIGSGLASTWYGHENDIAQYINDDWSFYTPQEGWFVWVKDENKLYRFDGSSWAEFAGGGGAGDMEKSTYDTGDNGIVDKAENVDDGAGNASTAADVKDAVTKKHTQNSDTHLGTVDQDISLNTHKLTSLSVPDGNGQSVRTTTKITEVNLEDAIDKKHANTLDHTQGSDTALGAQAEDLDMNTNKIVGVVDPISDQDAETKKHVADTYATIAIANKSTIGITIDGGGVELTTGYKGFIRVPWNCTITKATLLSDISGNIVIDLWKCSYADYDAGSTHPVDADSITASAPPTLSGATKSEDDTLTAWTTGIDAGDIIAFNIDSITDITKVTLILEVTKT